MDEHKYNQNDPWEPGIYETGRTRPPKSHNGLIAVLLVVVIFLSGLVSFLGLLNVRLFAQLKEMPEKEENPVSFVSEEDAPEQVLEMMEPTEIPTEIALMSEDPDSFPLNPSPDSVPNVPQNTGLSLQDIYEKTIGSVVSISCSGYSSSTGTGVVITESGYVVTNSHVIQDARVITVLLSDGRSFDAALVGSDPISDLAVLHIEADNLSPAEFGDSSVLRVGDSVAAIGDPDEIARTILASTNFPQPTAPVQKAGKRLRWWEILLLVLGSPVWLSLIIAVAAVIFSLWISLWSVVISLYATAVALGASAIGCLLAVFFTFDVPGSAAVALGAALICAGLTILIFMLSNLAAKGMVALTKITWKSIFARKEKVV